MNFLSNRTISVGYNLDGQRFFDVCAKFKKYIGEIYFSTETTMPGVPIDKSFVLSTISNVERYDFPLNIVLNRPEITINRHIENLEQVLDLLPIQKVTVLDRVIAYKIHEKFPNISIDLSTHSYIDDIRTMREISFVNALNISEPDRCIYSDEFIREVRDMGIKIRYIVNRQCLYNTKKTIRKLFSPKFECCKSGTNLTNRCKKIMELHPWLAMVSTALYKEDLIYNPWIDCIKLSTRELQSYHINDMLMYWTTQKPTEFAYGLDIRSEERYSKFLQIEQIKANCSHICRECLACKYMYDELIGELG